MFITNSLFLQKDGEEIAQGLMVHMETYNYMFTLLAHDKTCMPACQFLEDLLQSRKQVLNLTQISKYFIKLSSHIGSVGIYPQGTLKRNSRAGWR